MTDSLVDRMRQAVAAEMSAAEPALLAVSGGIDSMVLLDAVLATRPPRTFRVATFDHASGPHTAFAVDLVEHVALSAGASVIVGRSQVVDRPSEASWRSSRLAFLRAAAAEHRATVYTAHTRDDQVETVLFRLLRGAGARGLAGLKAPGDIRRPLLGFSRADVTRYGRAANVSWVDDPTNDSRAHARNRIRLDLLPALRAHAPTIDSTLVDIGERAARWRADVDAAVASLIDFSADLAHSVLDVSADSLEPYGPAPLAVIWPALLARIGVTADWRGTRRLVAFTKEGSAGRRIQLSGGWVVFRHRSVFEVRRQSATTERLGEPALPFFGGHHRTL
jgi:tRNA(Ile)-lysidine synthase